MSSSKFFFIYDIEVYLKKNKILIKIYLGYSVFFEDS